MRNRFQNFMSGRYGNDQLNNFLITVALIIIVITFFVRLPILDLIPLILYVITLARALSRNTSRRYAENEKYLDLTAGIRSRFGGRFGGNYGRNTYGGNTYSGNTYDRRADAEKRRQMREQKKIYRFYYCPHCSQKVRVPKGKGKICITCPKCRTEFVKRT